MNERAMLTRMHKKLWGVVQEARRTRGVELSKGGWASLIQVGSKAGKTFDVSLMMEAMVADGVGGGGVEAGREGGGEEGCFATVLDE